MSRCQGGPEARIAFMILHVKDLLLLKNGNDLVTCRVKSVKT